MFEGRRVKPPVGGNDTLVFFAERYHWQPDDVLRLDPDLVDELVTRARAEKDVEDAKRKRAERAKKNRPGPAGEDVDLSEIA